MRKSLLAFLACALIGGCASSSKTYGPDGREAFSLDCSGWGRSWGACVEKAGDICGAKGYDVVSQTGDRSDLVQGSSSGWSSQFSGVNIISRHLVIACKG